MTIIKTVLGDITENNQGIQVKGAYHVQAPLTIFSKSCRIIVIKKE